MAYEKMHNIFDLAIRMQSSAEGISITDVMQQFDVSRRTAERMRNFIRERFPQLTETIGEHGVKRPCRTGRSKTISVSRPKKYPPCKTPCGC